jgi:hypothetical protein
MLSSLSRVIQALCILATVVAVASPAAAISRISATTQSCAALRQIIDNQGAVIVTHPGSRSSGTLYDRYVRDSSYCQPGYVATDDWVPAKDRNCRLYNCQTYEPDFDR